MVGLVIGISLLTFCIIVIIFSKKGKEYDLMQKRFNQIQDYSHTQLDEELTKSFAQRFIIPQVVALRKLLVRKKRKRDVDSDEKLEAELKMAGLAISANEFSTIKYIVMGFFIIIGFVFLAVSKNVLSGFLFAVFFIILGILIPRYFLQMKISVRRNGIRNQIPDVMDILSVSLEAGLGFDASIVKISNRIKGPFVDELTLLHKEIQLGKPRREALKALNDRNSVEEVKTFAAATIQAETLGISIKNVLKLQADQLRLARREIAEEKGKKAPIKMMLPLVLFIFPVIFIILLGPTIIQLINQFT